MSDFYQMLVEVGLICNYQSLFKLNFKPAISKAIFLFIKNPLSIALKILSLAVSIEDSIIESALLAGE